MTLSKLASKNICSLIFMPPALALQNSANFGYNNYGVSLYLHAKALHVYKYIGTSVYLKTGLVPCSELIDRGRSLRCLRSRLSSVKVSRIFLLISSPVEHRLVAAAAVVAGKVEEGEEEEEEYKGRERRGSNWWAVQIT